MGILKSTNSGMSGLPLTPETAIALGWKLKREDGQKNKQFNWRVVELERDDVCIPIQFRYEPQDQFQYCNVQLYFFGDDDFNLKDYFERNRHIKTTKELLGCLEFCLKAQECREKMTRLYKEKIEPLYNPNEKYYKFDDEE